MKSRSARRLSMSSMLAPAVLAMGLVLATPLAHAQTSVERVVVVVDPPAAESNRFWTTGGGFGGLDPAFQRLIGNDTETGAYDNSGLAESWETNDDFTEWTFHLKPEAEWHFGWGGVTAEDVAHSYELHTAPDVLLTGVRRCGVPRSRSSTSTPSGSPSPNRASISTSRMPGAAR